MLFRSTPQPVPISIGINDFPDKPNFLKILSIINAIRAIYPQSSNIERKKNNTSICGKNPITAPTPPITPSTIKLCNHSVVLILSKKDDIFMNAMTYMRGTALAAYLIFATIFIVKTANHIPVYFSGLLKGMMNPVNAGMGIPIGFVLGMQKVLQTVESGLGCLAMSAQQSDSEPREAGTISLIPSIMTLFIAIFITSYIASYGIDAGIINYGAPNDAVYRLSSFFNTASSVTGTFGLAVMALFTVLSAMTTILGSYYYLRKLFKSNAVNKNIVIYMTLIISAGTLAIFGANVVFEAVDLLLFVCSGINLIALSVFAYQANKAIKNGEVKDINEEVKSA